MPRDQTRYLGLVCSWRLACRKCSSLTCVFLTPQASTMRMHHWKKEVSKLSVASSASPKSYVLCGRRTLQTVCGAYLKSQLSERSTPRVVLSLLLWVLKSLWQCWCRWRQLMESLSCSYLPRDRRCLLELLRLALQPFLLVMVCTCSDERCNPKRICLPAWTALTWTKQPWLNGLHIIHIILHHNSLHWCVFFSLYAIYIYMVPPRQKKTNVCIFYWYLQCFAYLGTFFCAFLGCFLRWCYLYVYIYIDIAIHINRYKYTFRYKYRYRYRYKYEYMNINNYIHCNLP